MDLLLFRSDHSWLLNLSLISQVSPTCIISNSWGTCLCPHWDLPFLDPFQPKWLCFNYRIFCGLTLSSSFSALYFLSWYNIISGILSYCILCPGITWLVMISAFIFLSPPKTLTLHLKENRLPNRHLVLGLCGSESPRRLVKIQNAKSQSHSPFLIL